MQSEIQISLAAARINAKMTQEEAANRLKISKRTIINWEKKHNSKPDWYDKKLRVLGEAILADEVLQGMRRELMARDNLKRGYTRGNHSKE